MTHKQKQALVCAAALAFAVPLVALWPHSFTPRPDGAPAVGTIVPTPVPEVAAVYERPLFAAAEGGEPAPADAPALVGIAGRLNKDAVALVRLADGSLRTLSIGESVDGWRLESLAIDAAFFTRGRERVRVAMAASETAADEGEQAEQ